MMKLFPRKLILLSVLACACPMSLPAQVPQAEVTNLDETTLSGDSNKESRRLIYHGGHEDITLIGDDVVIKQGETMHDLVIVGGSATVDGTVRGDFVVVLGSVNLGPTAKIKRGLTVVAGSLSAHPDAEIEGDRFVLGTGVNFPSWLRWPQDWFNKGLLLARPLPHQYLWSWVMAGLCLLIYLLISILFPQSVEAGVQVLQQRPGSAFLMGLLFVVLSAILAVTVVLIPFLLCGLVAAFLFGRVMLYRYAGQQLGGQLGVTLLQNPIMALLLGTVIFFLLYTIPVLGFIVWGAITPLCLGAVLLAFSRRFRSQTVNGPQGVAVAGMTMPPLISGEQTGAISPGTVVLPRVGFWQRFAATLIDAVLVGFLMALLQARPPAFVIIWTAYHVALWSWKGTTIGGMVFGLKIIRTDGRPINVPVALVRALSAFLSAAALCIGFFWAGWSRDKQSWHDKIAGTYVVKVPKGVSVF